MAMALSGSQRATINVTPMIDVLLVLLIIFMVVVNSDSVGLDSQVPQPPKETGEENPQDIVLIVNEDGSVSLNQEAVLLADLQERLLQVFRTRGNHVVFVGAERGLDFQHVVRVTDIARGAGLERVALLPRQPSNL